MFDIITFGSATWDVFVKPEKLKSVKDKKFITGKGVCFDLGSKVDLEDVHFSTGGGGTNTATTFKNQGFNVAYCGKVGDDISGREIIEELKKTGVSTDLILKTSEKPTNHSIVINSGTKERTILVYRGASETLKEKEIPFGKLDAKWLYLAPLSGNLSKLFEKLVDFAKNKGIKVAANLGNSQLYLPKDLMKRVLGKLDILILNQEEASILTKIPFSKENDIFKKIDEMCPGIAIMTKGGKGVSVSDGKNLYRAKAQKIKVADKTGAGDAFGSGFVSGMVLKNNIEYSISLGMANANGCISEFGAKKGLLKNSEGIKNTEIKKSVCCANCICQLK